MAKTKTSSEPRKLIRLDIDPASHDEVRLAAARRRVSMAQFARDVVVEAARKVNRQGDKS